MNNEILGFVHQSSEYLLKIVAGSGCIAFYNVGWVKRRCNVGVTEVMDFARLRPEKKAFP